MRVIGGLRARRIVAAAALALLPALTGHARPDKTTVRVGIARGKEQIRVAADGPFTITARGDDGSPGEWNSSGPITVEWSRGGDGSRAVLVDESGEQRRVRPPLRIAAAAGSLLKYLDKSGPDGVAYRGEFEIIADSAGLTLVNAVGVEDYLRGVVPCEMGARYPADAVKAQAVVARSYALGAGSRHQAQGFEVCDKEHCQVYGGASSETPATNKAIEETRGEVLTCNGSVLAAPYSAVCGGFTEAPQNGSSCLESRPDFDESEGLNPRRPASEDKWRVYFKQAPPANCCQPALCPLDRFRWVEVRRREELEKPLADVVNVGTLMSLRPLERGPSGRITRLEVVGSQGKTVLAPEYVIRKALGGLKSSAFVVDAYAGADNVPVVFVFWGAGMGHGIGMCQVGAAGLAQKGNKYREILQWYFPGCAVERRD